MDRPSSLLTRLSEWARTAANDRAYVFLGDRGGEEAALTYCELDLRARALAVRLLTRVRPGDRALLVFPPGLEFLVAFFGCLMARVIAVPMMMPRRNSTRDSSAAILANCEPSIALTTSAFTLRGDLQARFQRDALQWLAVDLAESAAVEGELPLPETDDIAFLQYTSGSTSDPKGVAVSHANLLANLEMIRLALGNSPRSTYVNWVPLYHDMGLILNALQAFYVGAPCVLMAPNSFMQRPLNWLRAIHHYKAEVACGPNFAYDLCVSRYRPEQMQGVDLSSWKVALNGAEPVRGETITKFVETFAPHGLQPNAIFPAYGMAEATLLISGGGRGAGRIVRDVSQAALQEHHAGPPRDGRDAQTLVGCGRALQGERIAIVDPERRMRLAADRVGEIWVGGPNVARTYWRNEAATGVGLQARIVGEDDTESWLRTGDLGFLDEDGELFVTGRIKDLIIIRGINHYPQDIEQTVQRLHPSLRQNGGAAFSVPDESGEEALAIAQEIERTERNRIDQDELKAMIREGVAGQHELFARHIVLIRPGTLPKTTSGKIQHGLARRLFLENGLDVLASAAE